MRYDTSDGLLRLSAREFITVARRGVARHLPMEEEEPELGSKAPKSAFLPHYAPVLWETRFPLEGYTAVLTAGADALAGEELFFAVPCDSSPTHPPRELVAEARGEAYLAALLYAEKQEISKVLLTFIYFNEQSSLTNTVTESVSAKKLSAFFEKCKTAFSRFVLPEVERVTQRLPSLAALRFPYDTPREGQEDLIHAVYRTVKRGGRLYAEAPTGTGKTVSTLYPALRAMANGACDKIFYFTPKGTTARAAEECLCDLARAGAKLCAVTLIAKERLCERQTVCKKGKALCPLTEENRLAEAVLALYREGHTAVTQTELRTCAAAFGICPYELALSYAELADVVICDFNYLFDPFVYLKRFFSEAGCYAFLIDEAHNLPERAAKLYSATLTHAYLLGESLPVGEHSVLRRAADEAANALKTLLTPLVASEIRENEKGDKIAAVHTRTLPEGIYPLFDALLAAAEREILSLLSSREECAGETLSAVRAYYYEIRRFSRILSLFDEHYEAFIFYKNGALTLELFCVDTGRVIADRLALGRSTVFFSGTLSPLPYYRTMLGADGADESLTLPSPFDRGQLAVAIMDKIGTRLSEREKTVSAVLRVIAATVSAKRGNYIIFSPSFSYNALLAAAFRSKYPKIRTIEQKRGASKEETDAFFDAFRARSDSYLVAFCVTGGVYSEGIDLAGESLIGTVIIGTGMPAVSYEREAMCAYFDERYEAGRAYAYIYPGINRVLQAGGRVIRREEDRGVIVLIDDRFADPIYRKSIPALWRGLKFIGDAKVLKGYLEAFWKDGEGDARHP